MNKQTEALKLALEALAASDDFLFNYHDCEPNNEREVDAYSEVRGNNMKAWEAIREALAEQPAQQEQVRVPVTDNTYNYAKSLAEAIFKQHFASDEHYASGRIVWGVNDTVIGILTQIDNMVADMVRRPAQQQEPVASKQTFTRAEVIRAIEAERHACSIAVWMTLMEATEPDADDKGLAGWMTEAEQRIKNRSSNDPEAAQQQEAQIVRWKCPCGNAVTFRGFTEAPASKPWVGLTEEDLAGCDDEELKQARYWENKLKEKNT